MNQRPSTAGFIVGVHASLIYKSTVLHLLSLKGWQAQLEASLWSQWSIYSAWQ